MKKFGKITVLTSLAAICATSVITTASVVARNHEESKPVRFQLENHEIALFSNNDDVREHFEFLNDENNVLKVKEKANVEVNLDSYQQSNKLSHVDPTASLSFNYNTTGMVSNRSFDSITDARKFIALANDSSSNDWSYDVSSWSAKAGSRYMGGISIWPAIAPEVVTEHPAKTYDTWSNKNVSKSKAFIVSRIKQLVNNIAPEELAHLLQKVSGTNFTPKLASLIKKLIIIGIDHFDRTFAVDGQKLKPLLMDTDTINEAKIVDVDFGNIKAKVMKPQKVSFQSNNALPISDYETHEHCGKLTCSHNLRNLVDVIETSAVDLIANNFYNTDTFLGQMTIQILEPIFEDVVISLTQENQSMGKVAYILGALYHYIMENNLFSDALQFMKSNLSDITFEYMGKVEKHGIQLGKCGHLISGIKICRDENIVTLNNDEPLVLYTNKRYTNISRKLFKNKTTYNYNTLQCIVELTSYQELYNFINESAIPEMVKSNLIKNISNLSLPSSEIYEQYLNYVENGVEPQVKVLRLASFVEFIADGWKIPKDINTWNLLSDHIIPSYFSDKLATIDNQGNKQYYFNNYNFTDSAAWSLSPLDRSLSDSLISEPLRFVI